VEDKKSKLATAATAISAGVTAYNFGIQLKEKREAKKRFTATVNESAYIYRPLMVWINKQVNSRHVTFLSRYNGVFRFYSGSNSVPVNIEGHTLFVSVQKPNMENRFGSDGSTVMDASSSSSMFSDNLVFIGKSAEDINALERLLVRLTEEYKREEREVNIYNPNSYHGWDSSDFAYRDLDSVFLPEGVMETFVADVKTFLENESRYISIGIPWHRGYLLYGEPGNGKSTLVASLAHRYHFSLYNLPLSGVKDDKHLAELIARIPANSVLLLEDIDIFSRTMVREQHDHGPTLAGLLNALDGVNTPHGLLTFITTNRKETLDHALIRPGRIDFELELKKPVRYQVDHMFARVYDEELGVEPRQFESMAALANVFKTYPNDSESARMAIKKEE
jgi:hypothetical protein